jgi:hypothetical protein
MRVGISPDQKAIVLSKGEDAAFVWAGSDSQVDLHFEL